MNFSVNKKLKILYAGAIVFLLLAPGNLRADTFSCPPGSTDSRCFTSSPPVPYTNPGACQNGVCGYLPLEPLPGVPQTGNADFASLMAGVFRLLISLGAMFAVVMLVVAGIGYMLSESALDIRKAKSRAEAALWGLLLLAASWLILAAINPNLLKFSLLPGSTGVTSPGTQTTTQRPPLRDGDFKDCEDRGKTLKLLQSPPWWQCE